MVDHIEVSKDWARNFVVKEGLCPFAKDPLDNEEISWEVVRSVEFIADLVDEFIKSKYKTQFLIFSFLGNFKDFLDVADFAQHLVDALGYSEDIGLVLFHPENQYAESDFDDPINYANRAPFASIQLLRKKDLEALKMTEEWKAQILDRNAKHLNNMGGNKLSEIFDGFRK